MDVLNLVWHEVSLMSEYVQQKYNQYLWMGDPRTQHFFGVRSPVFIVTALSCYLIFILKLGPYLMRNREPFQMRKVLIIYNLFITVINAYICFLLGKYGWFSGHYNWTCEPVNYSAEPHEILMTEASNLYYMSKFIEMLDTVFFVLRKKNRQLSGLHIYHHSIMPVNVYLGMKFCATGHVTFFALLNSFVHVPMYLYYCLSAIPSLQKYLWWKKYLTMMQLVQFVIVAIHTAIGIYLSCKLLLPLMFILFANTIIFLLMFSNFYKNNYAFKPKSSKANHAIQNGFSNGHAKPHENGTVNGHSLNGAVTSAQNGTTAIHHNLRSRSVRNNRSPSNT